MLPLKACSMLGQRAASFGELFEADRLGLVGIDQPLIGTSEPVEPCPDLLLGGERVLRLRTGASDEVLELRQQPLRVGEQPADMCPDGCLQLVAVDLRARAGDLACGHHAILAGAAIGAPDEAVGRAAGDPVHGQTAGAAGEQATKQVVVLLVVPERQPGIVGQLRLRAIPEFLADDGRDRDRDPLLARPQPAAALARVARLARARLSSFDEVVPVRVSGPGVDRLRQDVVDHRGRPGMPARARVRGPEVQPFEDLADGHPSIDQPAVERPDKIRFGRVDLEPSTGTIAAGDVAVAVGCASADEVAGLRLLQLATAEALAQERALVLGDSALDLQEELVAGVVGDAVVNDAEAAKSQWRKVADQLRPTLPKLAALMDESETDVLAYMSFPAAHRAKLHSVNPLERLNGEIKRRTDVVGIFPNEAAITRLVVALLLKQNDEWAVQRTRYMTLETIAPLSDSANVSLPILGA